MKTALLLNPLVHFFFDALRFVGLRDRLRCPTCKAVGTWKPHGGILDREDQRKVRRWMCKWCGHYIGPDLNTHVFYSPFAQCWIGNWDNCTPDDALHCDTPADLIAASRISGCWPWRG